MRKTGFFFIFIFFNSFIVFSQPVIQWQKSLGGSDNDQAFSIQQTNDGGFILAGYSYSNDSDVTGNHGFDDYWIVKLDISGSIQWQKSLGGTEEDAAYCIRQTNDGGYIVAGSAYSNNGDVSGGHGDFDDWIVKLDSNGVIQWQKPLGGDEYDVANSIEQTMDGGYVFTGYTYSDTDDVSVNYGYDDYWVVKLNDTGDIQWEKSLGGSGYDFANLVKQTSDGGYIVAGATNSTDGDVTGVHGSVGYNDYWIVKLNSNGVIEWQKALGGTDDDVAYSVVQTPDFGFVVAGASYSSDGDVSFNHGTGTDDCWVVKLDSAGNMEWEKSFGGSDIDGAYSISLSNNGGYILSGYSRSNDGDVTGNHGDKDFWIAKLDAAGNIQWQQSLGGSNIDVAYSAQQNSDNSYVVAGYSLSNDGNVSGHHGFISNYDCWVVKLNPLIGIDEFQKPISDFMIFPNPFSNRITFSFMLSSSETVYVEINDILGRRIKQFDFKNFKPGKNEFTWDATDDTGNKLENGLYFISLISDNICVTRIIELINDK